MAQDPRIVVPSTFTGVPGSDTTAIHVDQAAEITGIALKASPVTGDTIVIEDSADSDAKKSVTLGTLPPVGGIDSDAIHVNLPGEIAAIAAKASPIQADTIVIEDSADSDAKKSVTLGNLPPVDGLDSSAIHVDTPGEIAAIAAKASPVLGDTIVIEDSEDSDAKKSVTLGTLPGNVSSVFGRQGVVVAVAGDYTLQQIGAGGAAEGQVPFVSGATLSSSSSLIVNPAGNVHTSAFIKAGGGPTFLAGARITAISTDPGADYLSASLGGLLYSASAKGPDLFLAHARGVETSPSVTLLGDEFGRIVMGGDDGGGFFASVSILGIASETQSPGSRGGELRFRAALIGTDVLVDKLLINPTDIRWLPEGVERSRLESPGNFIQSSAWVPDETASENFNIDTVTLTTDASNTLTTSVYNTYACNINPTISDAWAGLINGKNVTIDGQGTVNLVTLQAASYISRDTDGIVSNLIGVDILANSLSSAVSTKDTLTALTVNAETESNVTTVTGALLTASAITETLGVTTAIGVNPRVDVRAGTGEALTVTNGYGVFVDNLPTDQTGATTVTNMYGFYYNAPSGSLSQTVVNEYGLFIEKPVLGATINQALHVAGGRSVFNGSMSYPIRSVAASTTIDEDDHTIEFDAAGGAITQTLPSAAGITGTVYVLKRVSAGTNIVTITADGSESIDGVSSKLLINEFDALTIQSDGVNWTVLTDVVLANDSISVYDTTGGQTFTGTITVNLDTTQKNTNTNLYSLAMDQARVRYAGTYQVTYDCGFGETTGSLEIVETFIELFQGGGGFSELAGTRSTATAKDAEAQSSTSCTTVVSVTDDSGFRIRATRVGVAGTLETLADMSRLTVTRVSL